MKNAIKILIVLLPFLSMSQTTINYNAVEVLSEDISFDMVVYLPLAKKIIFLEDKIIIENPNRKESISTYFITEVIDDSKNNTIHYDLTNKKGEEMSISRTIDFDVILLQKNDGNEITYYKEL